MLKKIVAYFMMGSFAISAIGQQTGVTNLQVESRQNPIGVDVLKPMLSWELRSTQRNVFQTAYRILVADDSTLLQKDTGNIWDSKKISSTGINTGWVQWQTLQPAKKYFWKVMVWDNKGNVSAWSDNASWQMGLLSKSDPIAIGGKMPNGSGMKK